MLLSLSLFSCKRDSDACNIALSNTVSGSAFFENTTEKSKSLFVGDTVTIVATPKENCEFAGWFEGKEKTPVSTEANYTFVVSRSISLLARFAKSPVVSVESNGNGTVAIEGAEENSKVFHSGTEVKVVATPNKNCEFTGWFLDGKKVCADTDYIFKASKTTELVAKFIKSPVLTINSSDYGKATIAGVAGKSAVLLNGSKATVTATPDKDCEFEGWFAGDDKVCDTPEYTLTVSKNISLTAKFYPSPVVTIESGKNGSVAFPGTSDNSLVVLLGNEATVTATADKDYEFVGWFTTGSKTPVSTEANYTFAVSEDVDLVAKFKACPVVKIASGENGSAAIANAKGNSIIVFSGTEVTVTAVAEEGFELYGWFVRGSEDPVSIEDSYTFAVNKNVELFAEFRRTHNRHEYVDLGLPSGLKWSTCNMGAESPEKTGAYYAWGETEEKEEYSWTTYEYYDSYLNAITKYCAHDRYGIIDGKDTLEAEDDAAQVKWGREWRMPTKKEMEELRKECSWEWTTLNGVEGYKVTGPNGNSMFLPVTGYYNGKTVCNASLAGYYWTSNLLSKSCGRAYYFSIDSKKYEHDDFSRRYSGRNIRPVFE